MCVVMVAQAVVIVRTKIVQCRAIAQHGSVTASVFSKQRNAVIAKTDEWGVGFTHLVGIGVNTQT